MRKVKIRNYNAERDIRDEALQTAKRRLTNRGIKYPLVRDYSDPIAHLDALDAYCYAEQAEYRACLRELEATRVNKPAKNLKPIWSEIAYG